MKRALDLHPVVDAIVALPPQLRARVLLAIEALIEEPEPLGARPYGGIPGAFEIVTDRFTVRYTYGDEHVSVWIVRVNT